MRLVAIRTRGREEAAIVSPGGPLPVREINGLRESGETDLLSLLESGRFHELRDLWNGLSAIEVEDLSGRAIPHEIVSHGPLLVLLPNG